MMTVEKCEKLEMLAACSAAVQWQEECGRDSSSAAARAVRVEVRAEVSLVSHSLPSCQHAEQDLGLPQLQCQPRLSHTLHRRHQETGRGSREETHERLHGVESD